MGRVLGSRQSLSTTTTEDLDLPFVRPAKLHVAVGAKGSLLEVKVKRSHGQAHVDQSPGKRKQYVTAHDHHLAGSKVGLTFQPCKLIDQPGWSPCMYLRLP